jgi:hypothetical protein
MERKQINKQILFGGFICFLFLFTQQGICQKHIYDDTIKDTKNFNTDGSYYNCLFPNGIYLKDDTFSDDALFQASFFKKGATFNHINFGKNATFSYCTFSKNADFSKSYFSDYANFDSVVFSSNSYFSPTVFRGSSDFHKTFFGGDTYFSMDSFNNTANFCNVPFYGNAYFFKTVFKKNADFKYDTFYHNSNFYRTTFSKNVNFYHSTVYKDIYFTEAVFLHKATFSELYLKPSSRLLFYRTILPDTVDFSYIFEISKPIDLTNAKFTSSDTIHIFLYKSDISKIYLDYIHFRLLFVNPMNHIVISSDERKSIYELVLKNFKDKGQKDSYEALDKEYQAYKWSVRPWYTKWFGIFDKWWWNYGYEKWWVFIWTFGFILVFVPITLCQLDNLKTIYDIKIKDLSTKNRLYQSILFTICIFFPLTLKSEQIKSSGKGLLYIVFVYLMGLICVAYIANFILHK